MTGRRRRIRHREGGDQAAALVALIDMRLDGRALAGIESSLYEALNGHGVETRHRDRHRATVIAVLQMVDRTEVSSVMERCRSAWPGVVVDDEAFAAWLDTRVPDGTTLASLPITDLYLACACASGNELAIEQFDEHLLREVSIASAKMRAAPTIADEARQVVRELLFVPRTDRSGERSDDGAEKITKPPAINNYAGRGDLRGWVKVIATREVLRLVDRDKTRREISTDDDSLLEALSPKDDPELEQMKATFRDEFGVAFREAIAEMTPRERTLLRHSVVDGLGIEAIGALYKVHRSTSARWLEQARDNLATLTRRRLGNKLKLTEVEVESVIRLIHSRLDVSIQRHLKK